MPSFAAAVETIKGDVSRAAPADLINPATNALGILGRNRVQTQAVTTHPALHRALHGAQRSLTSAISPKCRLLLPPTVRPSPYPLIGFLTTNLYTNLVGTLIRGYLIF